jgi:hypothetical protein
MSLSKNITDGMWDEPIAELKVGGINGISFRKNTVFGKRYPTISEKNEIWIVDLLRTLDELDQEVFLIFGKRGSEGETRLLKVSKGEPVYVTFDVFDEDEDED